MKTKQHVEKRLHKSVFILKVLIGALFLILLYTVPVSAQQDQTKQTVSKEQQQRLDLMKSKGVDATLTILPVGLGGKPEERVSEVVGLCLEQQGLKNIELHKAEFNPETKPGLQELSDQLGKFVKGQTIQTDYVLYAQMNGDKQTHSINEVIGIVVDKAGLLVWSTLMNSQDEAFKKVEDRDPAGFSMLLAQVLGPRMGLNEETLKNAKPGKMQALMEERSGLPPESERASMADRLKVFREKCKQSTLVVFPVRVDGKENSEAASNLIKMINNEGICEASQAKNEASLHQATKDPNEMKIMWDMARDFRDYVRKNPVDADYTLYADFGMPGYVHFVVCDRSGEWIIADLQNSGHLDFRAFNTSTADGCDKLVATRIQHYIKTSVAEVLWKTIQETGIDAADAKFKELRTNMTDYYLSEDEMNALGYEYLYAKKTSDAIAIFKMNVEAFPESFNTYDSLGEAYVAAGEKDLAIRNYEKSVQLNPKSQSGIEALKKLKGK